MQTSQEKTNPGAGTPGLECENHRSPEQNTSSPTAAQDFVRAPLIREFVIEQANLMGLADRLRSLKPRGKTPLAGIHLDQIRLVGKEIVRSFAELLRATGGAR